MVALSLLIPILPLALKAQEEAPCPFSESCCQIQRDLVARQEAQLSLGSPTLGELEAQHDALTGELIILEGLEGHRSRYIRALNPETDRQESLASMEFMVFIDRALESLRDTEDTQLPAQFLAPPGGDHLGVLKDQIPCESGPEESTLCGLLSNPQKAPLFEESLSAFMAHYRATLPPEGESLPTVKSRFGRYKDILNRDIPESLRGASLKEELLGYVAGGNTEALATLGEITPTPNQARALVRENLGQIAREREAIVGTEEHRRLQREIEDLTLELQGPCGMAEADRATPCPHPTALPNLGDEAQMIHAIAADLVPTTAPSPLITDSAQGPISVAPDPDPQAPTPPPPRPDPPRPPPPPPAPEEEEVDEAQEEARKREEELAWARGRQAAWRSSYFVKGQRVGQRPSTASLLGYAMKGSAPNIMGAVMATIFRPNYDSLYGQAIHSKNTEYLFKLWEKRTPPFYSPQSPGQFPCAPLFCTQTSPYFNPQLNPQSSLP